MKTVTLTGWGQPHDALKAIAPAARHIDYAAEETVEKALARIGDEAYGADIIIGWSMGGQMALRAIAQGMIAPRRLVLIATPYQFVKHDARALGMGRDTFAQYRQNYARNPERTLHKSYLLIAHQDMHADRVQGYLHGHKKQIGGYNWLYWLDTLAAYSCDALDLSILPPTLLIHGNNDVVVEPLQSAAFKERIPQAELRQYSNCGHAPHWHNHEDVRAQIERFVA